MGLSLFLANNKLVNLVALVIIASAIILMVTSVWDDSPIVDEIPHIGAGYSYIAKGDHRLNPEHPPLVKDLAGLSLKIYGIKDEAAFADKSWQEDINGQWDFGRKLLFGSGNNSNIIVRVAKLPELLFFLLAAFIIFKWTKKLYGHKASLIALFLFSFSPTVMAHSRFVTTDVPALFGILLGTYFFVNYLEKPTKKNLWLAGIMFGIAELTKYSVFLLVPFFLGLAIIYAFLIFSSAGWRTKLVNTFYLLLSTVFIIAIGYIFVVWPAYYFHTWKYPIELQHSQTQFLMSSYGNRVFAETINYLSGKPVVRGLAEYGLGLLMVNQRSIGGNTTYFMGEVRNWAWPQYFPIVYFIKEPLAFWGLLSLVLLITSSRVKSLKLKVKSCIEWSKNHFTELVMILWIAAYWYVSIRANLNIGVRHLMPIYGFTFILISGALVNIYKNINSKKLVIGYLSFVISMLGWYLFENLNVYPFYLTYFNQVAGGPREGYQYVVDSNIDWGQDLKRLTIWVEENNIQKVNLDYFGWADVDYYLKDKFVRLYAGKYNNAREFLADNPQGGYMAISASYFMGSIGDPATSYAWLNNYPRLTTIGNSIFIWHLTPTK